MKNTKNLIQLASQRISETEMKDIYGGGKACSAASCDHDIHTSVNNTLDVMRKNNPPVALR